MTDPIRRQLSAFVLTLILRPSGVEGQTARRFEELQSVLSANDVVVVEDTTGQKTKGKVVTVSVSSLVVSTPGSTGAPEPRTFARDAVTEIRAADPLWNGALIGAAAGTGLAMWDYLIDPSEPGNAAIFTVAIGLGTAIGAGIDALTSKVLYVSSRQPPRVRVSPLLTKGRQGVLVNVGF